MSGFIRIKKKKKTEGKNTYDEIWPPARVNWNLFPRNLKFDGKETRRTDAPVSTHSFLLTINDSEHTHVSLKIERIR